MLSQKPWTLDVIVRLLLGAFICLCLGSLATSVWHYAGPQGTARIIFLCMAGAGIVLLIASLVVLSQPWKLEDLFRPLLLLLGCLSAGLCFAAWAQKIAN